MNPTLSKNRQPLILVANGVNLDLLGQREEAIYGKESLADLETLLRSFAQPFADLLGFASCHLEFFQTNAEAEFLNKMTSPWDGALINPGAWTHSSLALADRLAALNRPFIEVHLSHLAKREAFRHHSYLSAHALGSVQGLGLDSYLSAFFALLRKLA